MLVRALPILALLATLPAAPAALAAQQAGACPHGVVERIEIETGPVFPTGGEHPLLVGLVFRAANTIHVETDPSFIRRELLFDEGDCYDPFLVAESRRLLDQYNFIDQAQVEAEPGPDGGKVVRVRTRDRWSTQVDVGWTYDAGLNLEVLEATETNLLGQGVTAEISHRQYRDRRDRGFRLFTPRLFGRTDADLRAGETRAGSYLFQRVNHGFAGEASRWSLSELFERTTQFRSYATDGAAPFSHVLVPMRKERAELAAGHRFGEPGRSWIAGLSLERSEFRRDGPEEFVVGEDFGGATPGAADLPPSVARQTVSRGATRLGLHVGARRLHYIEYAGLDALSDVHLVPLGMLGSVSVGRSLGILTTRGVPDAGDSYARGLLSLSRTVGAGVARVDAMAEAAWAEGDWRDLVGQIDAAWLARSGRIPDHTMYLRLSSGGAWRTTLPFQLALGGRHGVRSLAEDRLPGGRRVVATLEDRIRLPWPRWSSLELGGLLFADAGRTWAGDVPWGSDEGWKGSLGLGLVIVTPGGSGQVWRPEIAFPVGHPGSPVFRVTGSLPSVRGTLNVPRIGDSRRFWRGAEEF
jgi:hypothetical protein